LLHQLRSELDGPGIQLDWSWTVNRRTLPKWENKEQPWINKCFNMYKDYIHGHTAHCSHSSQKPSFNGDTRYKVLREWDCIDSPLVCSVFVSNTVAVKWIGKCVSSVSSVSSVSRLSSLSLLFGTRDSANEAENERLPSPHTRIRRLFNDWIGLQDVWYDVCQSDRERKQFVRCKTAWTPWLPFRVKIMIHDHDMVTIVCNISTGRGGTRRPDGS
jgi:hypothetical protein